MSFSAYLSAAICVLAAPSCSAQKLQDGNTCRIATFLPFQDLRQGPPDAHADSDKIYGYGTWPDAASLTKSSFSLLAASEMARLHFNERNSVLVPELSTLSGCDIQIPDPLSHSGSWILDSGYDRRLAVETFLNRTATEPVCAIVGPVDDYVAQGLSPVAEAMDIPLIGFSTLSYRLALMEEYPMFARVIPGAYDFGVAVTKYFERDILEREVAGIIYDETDYGEQFESPIEDLEDEYDYLTITESFDQGHDGGIRYSLQEALDKGFRTIVLVTDQPAMLDDVARIADQMGMIGEGYFWIISGGALPPAQWNVIKYEIDSPTDRMLRGAALFTNYDNFMYYGEVDPFLTEWRKQTLSLSRLIEMTPFAGIVVGENYFKEEMPAQYASLIYDAVITAGISACAASSSSDSAADRNRHFTKLLETSFKGASGPLSFKKGENDNGDEIFLNSRDAKDVTFGMYNIRAGDLLDSNESKYDFVLTHLYSKNNTFLNQYGEAEHGAWKSVQGAEFLFHDGTSNEPMPRRETADAHYISRGMFQTGIILSVLGLLIALLTGAWVFANRGLKIVKASQPEFLYLLSFGALLVAMSAIFVSFDEDKGKVEHELDSLCSAFPWFFVTGYLMMYCALFSKLWRLSKLLELRRRVVQFQQALVPFGVIVTCAFVVLVVWQTTSPFEWDRKVISKGEEPYETYGECTSVRHGLLPYVIPLCVLICATVGATGFLSWKLRNVQAELAESRWIFAGIFLHIQTWLVGIPLLYITDNESRDASYLMYVVLTFTFSTSQVCLVIWPKIYAHYFGGSTDAIKTRVSVTGPAGSHISGIFFPSNGNTSLVSTRSLGTTSLGTTSFRKNATGTGSGDSPNDTQSLKPKENSSSPTDTKESNNVVSTLEEDML